MINFLLSTLHWSITLYFVFMCGANIIVALGSIAEREWVKVFGSAATATVLGYAVYILQLCVKGLNT